MDEITVFEEEAAGIEMSILLVSEQWVCQDIAHPTWRQQHLRAEKLCWNTFEERRTETSRKQLTILEGKIYQEGECRTRCRVGKCPELDEKPYDYFKAEPAQKRQMNRRKLRRRALQLAKELGITDFRLLLCSFLQAQNDIVPGHHTHCTSRHKNHTDNPRRDYQLLCSARSFHYVLRQMQHFEHGWNPVYFDMVRTLAQVGDKSVDVNTTGNDKMRFTFVLNNTASGLCLPPYVLFRYWICFDFIWWVCLFWKKPLESAEMRERAQHCHDGIEIRHDGPCSCCWLLEAHRFFICTVYRQETSPFVGRTRVTLARGCNFAGEGKRPWAQWHTTAYNIIPSTTGRVNQRTVQERSQGLLRTMDFPRRFAFDAAWQHKTSFVWLCSWLGQQIDCWSW